MKQTFTRVKSTLERLDAKVYLLLAMVLFAWTPTKAQYCSAKHYYGCGWGTIKRYAAIEEVQFWANGKQLWGKAADGCNSTATGTNGDHDHDITTTPTFKLSYGGAFQIKMNGSNPGSTFYTTMQTGVWIDLNRDQDFGDAGEFLGNFTVATNNSPLPPLTTLNLQLQCGVKGSGASVIRIRTAYQYRSAWTKNYACGNHPQTTYNYGETENYAVTLENPKTLAANFFMPDTAFIKTSVLLRNANQTGYISHDWDAGADGSYEYNTVDAKHKFSTVGKHCVQLRSRNCLGSDSIVKCLEIITPPAPPTPDFVSDKNVVELYNSFQLTDLSNNGPIYWDWYMYQKDDSAATHIDGDDYLELRGGDETVNQNPEVFTAKNIPGYPGVGLWSVCLTASNDKGALPKPLCKIDYIEVTKGCDVEMGPGTLTSIPGNVITCAKGTLVNKDNGNGKYSTPESNLDALIAPCGATKIEFTFNKWKVKNNVNLKIYDGQDASGVALHPGNGFNSTNAPTKLVSNSGGLYFLWNSTGTQTDEGFQGSWTSEIGTLYPPVASFDVDDTLFNSKTANFTNTSTNATGEVFFTWDVEDPVLGVTNTEGVSRHFSRMFTSNQAYNVCMTVESCVDKDKTCKKVEVIAPDRKADLEFTADERRPKTGGAVILQATSKIANQYKWTFFPSVGVEVTTLDYDENSRIEAIFSRAGKYTVSLKGWNTADSTNSNATLIKDQYIVVINYCTPLVSVTSSADVAVNRVLLEDSEDEVLIDNESEESTYTDYTEDVSPAVLTFGGAYDLTISRNTAVNPMSRKVWIDWNIDGDFDDAGEEVAYETTTKTKSYTTSFRVPDLKDAFEGSTKMRIATSYKNDPNEPCGATSGVNNANRIGEFEDYAVVLSNDFTNPVITLKGTDTAYVELNKQYTDAGATAWDPTEGDITSRMMMTSDVDTSAAGIYFVTYSVNDASGNPATPKQRVVYVVVDQSAPSLTIKGQNPEIIEFDPANSSYNDQGATAYDDNDGDLTTAIQESGTVNVFKIGTYHVVYTVQDAQGNTNSATRTVIVQDTKAPVISNNEMKVVGGVNVVEVQLQSVFVDRTRGADEYNNGTFGPAAELKVTPNNGGSADVDTRTKGTTTATYTMTDESGNTTTLMIDYVVEDYIAPVINLNTLDTVLHPVHTPYVAVEPSVSDNLYDNTQVSLTRETDVNANKLGKYYDTYTATDASGNVSVKKRAVRVYDGIKPVIAGKNGNIIRLGLFSQVWLMDYIKMTDNYDNPVDLFNNVTVLSNDMNVYAEGIYSAVFQTSDLSGNVSEPFTLFIVIGSEYYTQVGVEDVNENSLLKVYPNPSSGFFNVNFNLPANEMVDIAIYDVVGNKVEDVVNGEMQNGNYTVDMTTQASGVYFVRMTVRGKVFNRKVILD